MSIPVGVNTVDGCFDSLPYPEKKFTGESRGEGDGGVCGVWGRFFNLEALGNHRFFGNYVKLETDQSTALHLWS